MYKYIFSFQFKCLQALEEATGQRATHDFDGVASRSVVHFFEAKRSVMRVCRENGEGADGLGQGEDDDDEKFELHFLFCCGVLLKLQFAYEL